MPQVSVLIPVFDGATVLPRAVGDALAQTVPDLEVIVIDDASADDSAAVAERLAREDPRVRLVCAAENAGPGAARTLGLRAAQGEWIAILDADDAWEPDRLERLIAVATAHRLDAVADNLALVDPGLDRTVGHAFPLAPEALEILTSERFLANTVPGGRVNLGWMQPIVRRAFLLRHGISWPALRHAEDMVFTMEILLSGARFGLIGWPGYRYTQRRGSVSSLASDRSRTRRSAPEQQRAVALVRDSAGSALTPTLDRRLGCMHEEISVTTHVLQARDAVEAGRWREAAMHILKALARPRALLGCLAARYGPRSRRVL